MDRTTLCNKFARVLLLLLVAGTVGCSTVSGMKDTQGEGQAKTFNHNYELVWKATSASVYALGLPVVSTEQSEGSGLIIASTPARDFTWGENVAIFVTKIDATETKVEVVSKRALATNIFAPDWTAPMFAEVTRQIVNLNAKPRAYLVRSTFDQLPEALKNQLMNKYDIQLYSNKQIGRVVERQVQNVSTPGSTAGSEVGSALASAVYVNNAISGGNYNMWTDISVGVLGGIAGSGGNKAPTERYIIQYSIRNLDDEISSRTVQKTSPIGVPIGECFNLETASAVDEIYCRGMSRTDIEKRFLQANP